MNKLPFLKPNGPAVKRKLSGVSKYGFSENDDMIESALHELTDAVDSKDHKKLINSIHALIECIMAKEPEESHAPA